MWAKREAFKEGATWFQSNAWIDAQGDNLPEYDREVVVLLDRSYLNRHDRTVNNQLANNKGMAIGVLVASLINEIELMGDNDSLAITVTKED